MGGTVRLKSDSYSQETSKELVKLNEMAHKAATAGDIDTLKEIDRAIRNLEAGDPAAGFESQEIPPTDSSVGSFGLGMGRTVDNAITGVQDIKALATFDSERRRELANKEAGEVDVFKQKTANNPTAAFAGQMAPLLPFAAGGTPGAAFARGAIPGILGFTENPMDRILMATGGGLANQVGRKLPSLLNDDLARMQQQGMKMTPEQRFPSLLDKFVSQLRSSKSGQQKVAKFNQKQITEEALGRLGIKGNTFTDDTLGVVDEKTGEMFKQAVSGDKNIFLGGVAKTNLQNILEPHLKVLRPKGEGKTTLVDFMSDIESNNGVLSVKNYQEIRSKFTKAIIKTTDADRRLAMGEIVEIMDNAAERSLKNQPEKLRLLKQARKRWRDFVMLSSPGIINDTGRVNTGKLRTLLNRKDRGGFMLNRDNNRMYEMLRLDKRSPQVANIPDPFTITNMAMWPLEKSLIGANRLPTRVIEGAPLAATVPLLREQVPSLLTPSSERKVRIK